MENLKKMIGEELYKQVAEKLGDTKKYTFGLEENYVTKEAFNNINEKAKGYKEQITDRDKQLQDLKEANKGNEELQAKLAQLEENNTKIKEEYEAKIEKSQLDYAIDLEVTKARPKNPKALKALLDSEKIKYEDGKVSGLSEQLEELKESESWLFEEEEVPKGTGFGKNKGKNEDDDKEFTQEQARKIRAGLF